MQSDGSYVNINLDVRDDYLLSLTAMDALSDCQYGDL